MICCWTLARQVVPDLVGPVGLLSRNVAPGLGDLEHVDLLEEAELVAGDEVGAARSGRSSGSAAGRSAGARR